MKIGLVQVDGKLPNLALMQICAYHESRGDIVEWFTGELFSDSYDKVYASKIFQFSELPQLPPSAVIGGTGIDFFNVLPKEIADSTPSYSLYPECNYHIGFSMKGCRKRCAFCCVPQKEGRAKFNSTITDLLINPRGENRLMLLDNDFFGIPEWKSSLETIRELDLKVCFVQGLNIRIISKEQAELLATVNYTNSHFNQKYLTFAWDDYRDKNRVLFGIQRCIDAGIPATKMQFFILIGWNTTPEQDMDRVMTLANLGCMPYVMPFNKFDAYQKKFARWVNHRAIFKTVKWEDYGSPRKRQTERADMLELV